MYKKIILSLLAVYCVFAKSDFIGNQKRAELFELTDNEIAVFRVNIPEDEFAQLKEASQKTLTPPPRDENGNLPPPPNFSSEDDDDTTHVSVFDDDEDFKTKNGTATVELNGTIKEFKKITFSLGGSSSRTFGKQGYNLKIRGNDELYGRSHFRIRPDAREATLIRSKLVCDIHNRLGLPSISANYITLYINDEYMGIYVLMDAIKVSWIEYVYGEKDTTHLYRCKSTNNNLTVKKSANGCFNDNENVTDNTEWIEFLTRLDAAESAEDIEDIFDIDLFLTEMAYEYLAGSWDHFLNFGHNYYLYKPQNDKWKFLIYDFDAELGQDIALSMRASMGFDINSSNSTTTTNTNTDYPSYSFAEWAKPRHLLDILIYKDSTRFDNILKKFVSEVFNPATLFPHIDKLKEYIRPYVELDKIPDENGKYPGRINLTAGDYSFAQWDANVEFTTVKSPQGGSRGYGLKYWILAKYRYVCKAYDMECDETYLDENYEYPIDKEVEATGSDSMTPPSGSGSFPDFEGEFPVNGYPNTQNQNGNVFQPTTTISVQPTQVLEPQCWAEYVSHYPCCSPEITRIYKHDSNGDWGYDFDKKTWCGISPYVERKDEQCWSEKLGYPCCKGCTVFETDEDGQWGYDFTLKKWCGIQSYCPLV